MGKDLTKVTTTFQFCDGGSCKRAHSEQAVREARAFLRNENLWDTTHTMRTRCNGRCEDAPTWIVQPGNFWYKNVSPEKAIEIANAHTKEQHPIEAYLLFKEGNAQMNSEKERKVTRPIFKPKNHDVFGQVLMASASPSDQYLYPLFKTFFEKHNQFEVLFTDKTYTIKTAHTVSYTDIFDITVQGDEINLTFAIGPISKAIEKDTPSEILDRKIGVSNVVWYQNNSKYRGAIQLKNRKGKHLITFFIPKENTDLWHYVLEIYLDMDTNNPRVINEA